MNGRERFQRYLHYQPADRAPNIEVGAWSQTVDRWLTEGLPAGTGLEESYLTFNGNDFFGLDRQLELGLDMTSPLPPFEPEVLEEDERIIVQRDSAGVVTRSLKDGSSMGQYLAFPVRDRQDFEALRRRYDPASPERYPADWPERVRAAVEADCPVWGPGVGSIGFFSTLRHWMGTENACTIFYDDPALAHEMCEFITDFTLSLLGRALGEVKLDYFLWWEDFSFKTGPLVSPALFREFLLPRYRRCNEALRAAGVDVIFLDTDGNPTVLLPLLLEAGVNGTYPIECAAGMDPLALRREFGRDLLLWGGVDKRALARGEADIRAELLRKLPPLLEDGGYIPQLDHLAPPDIPYGNWLYYLDLKRRLLAGATGL
jgi:Uroporphyrinogen decarboxylase (URO-D)